MHENTANRMNQLGRTYITIRIPHLHLEWVRVHDTPPPIQDFAHCDRDDAILSQIVDRYFRFSAFGTQFVGDHDTGVDRVVNWYHLSFVGTDTVHGS